MCGTAFQVLSTLAAITQSGSSLLALRLSVFSGGSIAWKGSVGDPKDFLMRGVSTLADQRLGFGLYVYFVRRIHI
jgi:hypothetical protein